MKAITSILVILTLVMSIITVTVSAQNVVTVQTLYSALRPSETPDPHSPLYQIVKDAVTHVQTCPRGSFAIFDLPDGRFAQMAGSRTEPLTVDLPQQGLKPSEIESISQDGRLGRYRAIGPHYNGFQVRARSTDHAIALVLYVLESVFHADANTVTVSIGK